MINLRKLNEQGNQAFHVWLEDLGADGKGQPPAALLNSAEFTTESEYGVEIDESRLFATQYELGQYLNEVFIGIDLTELAAPINDGMWNWLSVVFYTQLAPQRKALPRYIVSRKGRTAPLTYRHIVRTAFELVRVHDEAALICLSNGLHKWSDLAEQLTSRQEIARHRGFFIAASSLFLNEKGQPHRGVTTRPKLPSKRRKGDKSGFGGLRRLVTMLERLDLTYDTQDMSKAQMLDVLPREFRRWQS